MWRQLHLCLLPQYTTDASEYLLLRTIEYLILEAAQTTWHKMLSFLSWCTCEITVLFLCIKWFIDRSVRAYFFGPPCTFQIQTQIQSVQHLHLSDCFSTNHFLTYRHDCFVPTFYYTFIDSELVTSIVSHVKKFWLTLTLIDIEKNRHRVMNAGPNKHSGNYISTGVNPTGCKNGQNYKPHKSYSLPASSRHTDPLKCSGIRGLQHECSGPSRSNLPFLIAHIRPLSPERQSARMLEIKNVG